jgi:hypothetical protein
VVYSVISASQEAEIGESLSKADLCKSGRSDLKKPKAKQKMEAKRVGGTVQEVECKLKVLSSNPSTTKINKNKKIQSI